MANGRTMYARCSRHGSIIKLLFEADWSLFLKQNQWLNGEKFGKFHEFRLDGVEIYPRSPASKSSRRRFSFPPFTFPLCSFCIAQIPIVRVRAHHCHPVDEFILFSPKVFAPFAFVVSFGAYFAVVFILFCCRRMVVVVVLSFSRVCETSNLVTTAFGVEILLLFSSLWQRNPCLVSPVPVHVVWRSEKFREKKEEVSDLFCGNMWCRT